MRQTRLIMGMPITVEIVDDRADAGAFDRVYDYFSEVDERFSTYRPESEVMRVNRAEVLPHEYSNELREVLALAETTRRETNGFFNIVRPDGSIDPSGIVKGWAIFRAANLLKSMGFENFFIDAGGDIQSSGTNDEGAPWSVGIRNPFQRDEIVKVMYPRDRGVATSGSYIRGDHIYNPHHPEKPIDDIVSMTVVARDVCEADRFATAAFAMGREGILFIERHPELEGYVIDVHGVATMTSGFEACTQL